jgi:hypothetical protein
MHHKVGWLLKLSSTGLVVPSFVEHLGNLPAAKM